MNKTSQQCSLSAGPEAPPASNFRIAIIYDQNRASLVAQMVKDPPAMQEPWVRSLGQEDPLKKGMATHSSILAWRIPWKEAPGRPQSMGLQRFGHN